MSEQHQRRPCTDPGIRARALREFSRRILARARPRPRLSGRIRRRAHQGRLPCRADPGAIRRQRAADGGGGRDHGGDPRLRRQRRRLPCADVHHGHAAAAWQRDAEGALSAGDRARRAAAAGVRRHRADLRHRHAEPAHHGGARRRRLRRQRPEDLDLARRAFRSDAAARPHHAARAGREAHRRAFRLPRGHAHGQGPDHPADPHHDEPRHDRDLLRRHAGAGRESDRRGRRGVPLHPFRHERRAHPDRGRMHRRRPLVHRQGDAPTRRSAACSAARSGRTRACSSRSRAPMRRCAPPR